MKRSHLFMAITGASLELLLLNSFFAPSAEAGRFVLDQTPQTINRYFDGYKTRLTTNSGVTYTYAPAKFRRLFPKFPKSNFSITFVNNKAKKITLNFNGSFDTFQGDYNYQQTDAAKFYNYIFGYQPPLWQELSRHFGGETIYDYEYCLGDGVGNSFGRYGYKQFTDSASFYYDSRCEPPHKP